MHILRSPSRRKNRLLGLKRCQLHFRSGELASTSDHCSLESEAYRSQFRTTGRRSVVAAFCVVTILFLYILHPASLSNVSSFEDSQPPSDEQAPSEQAPPGQTQETVQQSHQLQPTPDLEVEPPKCSVKKVSMLYGAHKFEQLEQALENHKKHCMRWGCGLEILDRDLTDRKLYSKHYFLLLKMLQELSKPEEERQEWLL